MHRKATKNVRHFYECTDDEDFLAHFKLGYNSSPKMGHENKK
jgi:hypothetical protein